MHLNQEDPGRFKFLNTGVNKERLDREECWYCCPPQNLYIFEQTNWQWQGQRLGKTRKIGEKTWKVEPSCSCSYYLLLLRKVEQAAGSLPPCYCSAVKEC